MAILIKPQGLTNLSDASLFCVGAHSPQLCCVILPMETRLFSIVGVSCTWYHMPVHNLDNRSRISIPSDRRVLW